MKRYIIYARYSSDVQNNKSTEDQIYECKEYIRQNNGTLVDVYHDDGMSGAFQQRPDYQRLLNDMQKNKFDIILAEGLDRLSRNQADIARLYELAVYHDIKIITFSEGSDINEMHIAIKGMTNAMYLKDLKHKTMRGLKAVARTGKNIGRAPYGYDRLQDFDANGDPIKGELIINEQEALIVQRIFEEYSAGKSPRKIAKELNQDKVLNPCGRLWSGAHIRGRTSYGFGILNNEYYIGRVIWNRTGSKKDPLTGKKITFQKPESEWIIAEKPELKIISENLWLSVKAKQEEISLKYSSGSENKLTNVRRKQYFLSGLIFCAECGGTYSIISKDRYGCSNYKTYKSCKNGQTVRRQILEENVLCVLKDKLLTSSAFKRFISSYKKSYKKALERISHESNGHKKELCDIQKKISAILTAIESGIITESTKNRLMELEKSEANLQKLLEKPEAIPSCEAPSMIEYKKHIDNLLENLYDSTVKDRSIKTLQSLIERIVMHSHKKGLKAALYGNLENLLPQTGNAGFLMSGSQISESVGTQTHGYLTQAIFFMLPTHLRKMDKVLYCDSTHE